MGQGLQPSTRQHVQLIEPDLGGSEKESDYDKDKVTNIPDQESDYSSPCEDESGSDSHDDGVDAVANHGTESIEAEGEAAVRSKTGNTPQNVQWHRRQPVCYDDVEFKSETFPPPPLEDKTSLL